MWNNVWRSLHESYHKLQLEIIQLFLTVGHSMLLLAMQVGGHQFVAVVINPPSKLITSIIRCPSKRSLRLRWLDWLPIRELVSDELVFDVFVWAGESTCWLCGYVWIHRGNNCIVLLKSGWMLQICNYPHRDCNMSACGWRFLRFLGSIGTVLGRRRLRVKFWL